jgi:hypothetical protein
MKIKNCRIYIAGSARKDIDYKLLLYSHRLVETLVETLAKRGAKFVIGIGGEPHREDDQKQLPIIYDWTVLESMARCVEEGVRLTSNWQGNTVLSWVTQRVENRIPENRRPLWEHLKKQKIFDLKYLAEGWGSGAVRRSQMAESGDILVAISGGEGVEHAALEYGLRGKPVIPIDLDLGSASNDGIGGAFRLAGKMLKNPENFFKLKDTNKSGALIPRITTRQGLAPIEQVVEGIVELIEAFEFPKAFFVRLMDKDHPDFPYVEDFFRNTVDAFIKSLGYTRIEVGSTSSTFPWMNQEIFEGLHNCALAVVDLTGLRPNCFMELGYALGRCRRVVLTAKKETQSPFDSKMIECYPWVNSIPNRLRLSELKKYWARNANRPPLVKPKELL